MRKSTSGFTIVELLIVIVVIAILATISIVSYNGIQQRARVVSLLASLSQSNEQMVLYYSENTTYPPDLATVGISNSSSTTYQYRVDNSTPTPTYCITATTGTTSYKISSDQTTAQPGGCPGHGVGGVAAVTNLVPNPSFETGLAGWGNPSGAGYTVSTSTAQAIQGASSLALVGPSIGADRYVEITPYINVAAGTTYTVSAYAYITSTNTSYANGDVMFNLGTGSATYPDGAPSYNRSKLNQWQRISARVQVTTSGILRIRFCIPMNSTTYIDGVMVTATPTLQNYADGSSPNWVWNGTANNSTSTGPSL